MLLELAVGDAYGAGFEYVSEAVVRRHNDLTHYHKHPKHNIQPGCYTDDTQMSIAVAEALTTEGPWTRQNLAQHFVGAFKRDSREGYAGSFYAFLQSVSSGDDFLTRIRPTSDKSGAAMRAAPLGVLSSIGQVVAKCELQAAITHNTRDGINAAVAAALMPHYFLYNFGPRENLGAFLESQVPGQWSVPWVGRVEAKGWMSVRAAVTAVQRNHRLSDLLKDCISFGGDVDTVATIALAAGSCAPDIEQDLPQHLIDRLENGPYGRDYLLQLDARLMALVGKA